MRQPLALLALAACGTAPAPDAPPPRWVYAPPVIAPPIPGGLERGRLGRSQAPQPLLAAGVRGDGAPLVRPTAWPVPGISGPPRAVVQGYLGKSRATELIEIEGGRLLWRDLTTCTGAILGVTDDAIVCADGAGIRALGLDGVPRWRHPGPYLAMTDGRVLVGAADQVTVLDASDGDQLSRTTLPRGAIAESLVASCGNLGAELFASAPDGKLQRIAAGAIAWSVPIGSITSIDACRGAYVVVASSSAGEAGAPAAGASRAPAGQAGATADAPSTSLISIARPTGVVIGRLDGVRGYWEARDDSDRYEVSTEHGVAVWSRNLIGPPESLALPPLRELIAERGDARLVRATPLTAVVLDRKGVRAYVALGSAGAVLGERAILGATSTGAPGETVHRFGLPAERTRRPLRVPRLRAGVALPAELRDLPDTVDMDVSRAIAKPDTGMFAVAHALLDPADPQRLYAVALEGGRGAPATIAALDLGSRSWLWQRSEGCGPGAAVSLAAGRDLLVCAALGDGATVRATTRDGASRWTWHAAEPTGPVTTPAQVGDGSAGSGSAYGSAGSGSDAVLELLHTFGGGALAIDRVQIAGDTALVLDADRAIVLSAKTGQPRGVLSSDDGAPMRAILVALPAVGNGSRPSSAGSSAPTRPGSDAAGSSSTARPSSGDPGAGSSPQTSDAGAGSSPRPSSGDPGAGSSPRPSDAGAGSSPRPSSGDPGAGSSPRASDAGAGSSPRASDAGGSSPRPSSADRSSSTASGVDPSTATTPPGEPDATPNPLDGETTLLVAYERGRLVARLPGAGLFPVWTLGIDGVVRALTPAGPEAFLVELDDGDAFRVDARTLAIVALPGLNLAWTATGDAVVGATIGGPIPGTPLPQPAPEQRVYYDGFGNPVPPPARDPEMWPLWTPVPAPPPLGDSWQLALFDLGGGRRTVNDYGVALPVLAPGPRGPRGSPVVVRYGVGGNEVLVVDPQRGDPLRRLRLPDGAGFVFGTVVGGVPVAGTLLARPLRAVLF